MNSIIHDLLLNKIIHELEFEMIWIPAYQLRGIHE
jgi:hypothetical protein